MTFSRRTAHHAERNALARALAESLPLFDLAEGNPTRAELPYDPAILTALARPEALVYEPAPLGLPAARARVAALHRVAPERVAITASTSEAYGALFKLLCDPGDEVLVPRPSYPLLAWLAAFEHVVLRPYPLVYAGGWHVDLGALSDAIGPRTRAIVVVHPNNPTGSYLRPHELEAMLDLDVPIISDEVFATYPLVDRPRLETIATCTRGLTFALSGLSKLVGLPQMKLGFIACGGDARADEAMDRLETVLDAYLSVAAPVQHALPELLERGKLTADAIRARTQRNLRVLHDASRGTPISVLDADGGWYAIVRVPETHTDEEWALRLLVRERVHVQPGYFFDLDRGAHLVVSLLTPEATFAEGARRIAAAVTESPAHSSR
jgi:alanine-synthesizing transaminase